MTANSRRRPSPAWIGAAAAGVLSGAPVAAQDDDGQGGQTLRLGVSQRLEAVENFALDSSSDGVTSSAITDLDLAFRTQTRGQLLSIRASGDLRRVDDPDPDDTESFGFYDPDYAIRYRRTGPGASLSADARLSTREISFLRRLDDFIDETGQLVIPDDLDDFDDLNGSGTRRVLRYGTELRLRQDTPFAIAARARVTDTSYEDTTATDLFDERRATLGIETRATLTPVHVLTTSLSYTRIEDDDPSEDPERDAIGFDATLALARPAGSYTATLGLDDTNDGLRVSASLGLSRERRSGTVGGALGLSRGEDGDLGVIGSVDFARALPEGRISLRARRSFISDGDDEAVTVLSADYSRRLTPLMNFGLDADLVASTDADSDETETDLSLGASLSRRLDRDWTLTGGVTSTFRHDEGRDDEWAQSHGVYVTVGRSFDWRF